MSEPHPENFNSAAPYFTPRAGDVLAGKYRVESTLGSGGMGVVVLVEHIELGQRMAIKLMTPGVNHDPQNVARFLREARSAAGIQSEHVVRIFDVGTFDTGAPYMVMELLRGEDLGQLLATVGRLPIHEAVDYVLQACHAIAEAHAMGIVHRDLKPSNLFLTRRSDGSALVKVLDFGISKAMNPDKEGIFSANLTATSAVMGSPLYMSPEQVRNAKQVDARADIWSLGVILHELLTGAPAFNADTLPGICAAIIADEPPPLRSQRPDAPPELEAIVTRCLEKSVNGRFQSVRELMAALRAFASANLQLSPGSRPIASTLQSSDSAALAGAASGRAEPSVRQARATDPVPAADTRASRGRTTPSPFEKSAAPVATSRVPVVASGGSRKTLVVVASIAVAAALGAGALALRKNEPTTAPAAASKVEQAPTPRKSFTLFIDSTPSGAAVVEGDRELGNTPMQISIDNDAARADPRKLSIRREGFQPYSILQGPSDDNVRILAALVALSAEAPGTAVAATKGHAPPPIAQHAPKPAKTAAPPPETTHEPAPPAPAPAPTPNPGDIRLQR
jgi:serine/threonine-protein kinase